jgi:formate dehydrogenase gamma subunit
MDQKNSSFHSRDNIKSQQAKYLLGTLIFLFFIFLSVLDLSSESSDCIDCHSDKELEPVTERGKNLSLTVTAETLRGSVHEDLDCTDCHYSDKKDAFEDVPHGNEKNPLQLKCASCHEDANTTYTTMDIHGKAYSEKNPLAPYCHHCHGDHKILPLTAPQSRMSRKNQGDNCAKCHGEEKLNLEQGITKRNLITRFKGSVHYQAIVEGKNGASCSDCHGHHHILPSASKDSTVARTEIMQICSKCHPTQVKTFNNGPHGRSLRHGNHDVPNCTTCHGDHDMASLRTRVGDAKQWASTQVCVWCHNNARMMARYGLDTTPVESYMNDFHGLTQRGTAGASATCSDCHDPHHSLPESHPSSRMHISNRGTTCGKCHGKVTDNFAQSFTHQKAMEKPGSRIDSIVQFIYIFLIIVTVGGMLFYNFIVWLYAVRKKYLYQRKEKHVKRMTRYERNSHLILLITFFTLAITGFALKFPEAFWVKWLFALGMNETIRASIHRLAAVIMTFDLILFMLYLFLRRRGRGILVSLLPRKRDFGDLFSSIKFYLSKPSGKKAPRAGIFNFGEKFEFWALIWGTFVMFVTGLILWLPKAIPEGWPNWVIQVARTIHYYEALLAFLAILVWHVFHTMFHPDEYPMNTSWITGYITEKEADHRFEPEAVEKMKKSVEEFKKDV